MQAQASLIAVKMVEVTTVGEQRSLEREIRVLRALRHPNIVSLHGLAGLLARGAWAGGWAGGGLLRVGGRGRYTLPLRAQSPLGRFAALFQLLRTASHNVCHSVPS